MLRLDFLKASDGTPLTKTYKLSDGKIETTPYPFVKDFTSANVNVSNLEEFLISLKKFGDEGYCLLKGNLHKPLDNESRAGSTDPNLSTEYLVLDLDFDEGFNSIDEFMESLHPALKNVSYIFQASNSAGITCEGILRGHVFVQLTRPALPNVIKQWLINKNLSVPGLRERVTLSANHMTLKYPLDISTCQNDKLIYISTPRLIGIEDKLKDNRTYLVEKENDKWDIEFEFNTAVNRENIDKKINELRTELGLKKRTAKYSTAHGEEILTNPDQVTVTGVKEARGYVYLNLNQGDSWAYYYPSNDPELLFNFKGEPTVRLKDIAPDYYNALTKTAAVDTSSKTVVFREPKSDIYYAGTYTPANNKLELNPISSLIKINHFLAQYDAPMPEHIEDWEMEFNPTIEKSIDFTNRWVNTFKPTQYMYKDNLVSKEIPKTINKVLNSICVDEETLTHFINWLAFSFQYRTKATTAWIFSGVQGTGKGILFANILYPLFGEGQAVQCRTDILEENFNSYLERALILFVDEFNLDDSTNSVKMLNKLKNVITEKKAVIRGMRKNPVQRNVYFNMILATNQSDSIRLGENDRRFNIAPSQETPIEIDEYEIDLIEDELPLFASYLRAYEVDKRAVNKVLHNKARMMMIAASETSVESFFRAIREGNLEFFVQYMRDKAPISPDNSYIGFSKAVKRWAAYFKEEIVATNEELLNCYNYLQNAKLTPVKFGRMLKLNRIQSVVKKVNKTTTRGVLVKFVHADEDELEHITKDNIVEIKNYGTN